MCTVFILRARRFLVIYSYLMFSHKSLFRNYETVLCLLLTRNLNIKFDFFQSCTMTTEEKRLFNYSLRVCNVLNMFYFCKKKNVSFVVDKVALGQLLFTVVRFSLVSIIPDMFNTHSFKHRRRYIILAVDSVVK